MINLKFRVWRYDMSRTLKKIVLTEVSKHLESCSSPTNIIMSTATIFVTIKLS